jgi:hypothetical protein
MVLEIIMKVWTRSDALSQIRLACGFAALLVTSARSQNSGQTTFAGTIDLAGHHADQICVNDAAGRIYVTDLAANQVLVVDASTGQTITAVNTKFPARPLTVHVPRAVAVSERLNRFYVPRYVTDSSWFVDVFDGSTGDLLNSMPIAGISRIHTLVAVDDVRRRVYVVGTNPGFSFMGMPQNNVVLATFDEEGGKQLAALTLGSMPGDSLGDMAVDQVSGRVSVMHYGNVAVVDGNTGKNLGSISSYPSDGFKMLAQDQTAGRLFIVRPNGSAKSYISVVDARTYAIVSSINFDPSDGTISDVFADELTHTLYVLTSGTTQHPPRIILFDETNGFAMLYAVDQEGTASNMVFDAAHRQILVSQGNAGALNLLQNSILPRRNLLGNISTRALIGGGDDALIGGFIVSGTQPKKVMLRAIGPSLSKAGVTNALSDPTLELHAENGAVFHNDDWQTTNLADFESDQEGEIAASGIAPGDPHEAAMLAQLGPGAYTAVVRGKSGATGVGLIEAYDLGGTVDSLLANVSTRGHVDAADNAMIGGVIVTGSAPSRVVFRAIGPSLADSGVLNPLADPWLELRDLNGGLIAANDDWHAYADEMSATTLAPNDDRESVIPVMLYPGNYTALVRGKNGATGVSVVEAYRIE